MHVRGRMYLVLMFGILDSEQSISDHCKSADRVGMFVAARSVPLRFLISSFPTFVILEVMPHQCHEMLSQKSQHSITKLSSFKPIYISI